MHPIADILIQASAEIPPLLWYHPPCHQENAALTWMRIMAASTAPMQFRDIIGTFSLRVSSNHLKKWVTSSNYDFCTKHTIWPYLAQVYKKFKIRFISYYMIHIYIYISKLSNSLHPKNPPPINRANMRVCCQLLTCTKLPISTSRLSKGRVGLVRFPAVMPSHDTIPDDIIIIRHLKKSHLVHTIILSINVRFRNVYPMLSFFFTLNLENW